MINELINILVKINRYDIWPRLKPRFGDMWFFEIYGSTEGNIQFANIMNDEGRIGIMNIFERNSSHL